MQPSLNIIKKSYLKLLRSAIKFKDENYKYYFLNKSKQMFREALDKNSKFENVLEESSQLENTLSRQAQIFNQYHNFEIKINK